MRRSLSVDSHPTEWSKGMNRLTVIAAGLATLVFLLTLMLSVTQGATASSPHNRTVPRWERALMARSRALDTRYHLGSYQPIGTGIVPPGHDPAWLRALDHRSIGLDQRYHLGTFTLPVVS
jgi:hypothetical protein